MTVSTKETGRFTPIYGNIYKKNIKRHPSERICELCNIGTCKDAIHCIFIRTRYETLRKSSFNLILKNVNWLTTDHKFKVLMTELMTIIQPLNCRQTDRISLQSHFSIIMVCYVNLFRLYNVIHVLSKLT